MSGMSILGICSALIGLGTMIYGGTLFPIDLLDSNFMSFVVGGLCLISMGISIISGISPIIKVGTIWLTVVFSMIYIYGFEMELMIKLISFVPIIGLALWITTKFMK